MGKSERLKEILLESVQDFEGESADIPFNEMPNFELRPHDYLSFAEQELNQGTVMSHINCVGHLKRALDCQIDTFFYVYNLFELFKKRNLKFDKKLEFLKAAGVFSSRTLSRFNTIRNKMEHDYKIPEIEDLEVYFDLVSALISLLEQATFSQSGVQFSMTNELTPHLVKRDFSINYQREAPCIIVDITSWDREKQEFYTTEKLVVCAKDEIDEFAFYFKVLNLLSRLWMKNESTSYLIAQLK